MVFVFTAHIEGVGRYSCQGKIPLILLRPGLLLCSTMLIDCFSGQCAGLVIGDDSAI